MALLRKIELDNLGYGDTWKYFKSAESVLKAMHIYDLLIKDCFEKKNSLTLMISYLETKKFLKMSVHLYLGISLFYAMKRSN